MKLSMFQLRYLLLLHPMLLRLSFSFPEKQVL